MSTTTTLRQVLDTWANQDRPADNFGKGDRLQLDGTTNHVRQGFVFFGSLPRPGVYVVSASLKLHAKGSWSSQTLTVKRITTPWKEMTLTWRHRPTTVTTHQATPTTGALSDGDLLSVDVTDIVRDALLGNGLPFYGFSLGVSGSATVAFRSSEVENHNFRPQLEITYVTGPTVAVDLVPGDADVIDAQKPVLSWTYADISGDEQGSFQVQIDATDFASPDFDTGYITSSDPQYAVADGAFGGWSANQTLKWRVRVKDDTGQESAWSDAVSVTRTTKGTLTIDAPSTTIEESTPLITTTLTGRDQRAIYYQLDEWDDVHGVWRQDIWHRSRTPAPTTSGNDYSFRVPLVEVRGREGKVRQRSPIRRRDTDYRLTVWSWDTVTSRVATVGDPAYVEAQRTFQWNESVGGPAATFDLVATPEGGGPGVVLTWHREAVPDEWILLVDGEAMAQAPASDWQESS